MNKNYTRQCEIFHELKASEISCHISQLMSAISNSCLQFFPFVIYILKLNAHSIRPSLLVFIAYTHAQ